MDVRTQIAGTLDLTRLAEIVDGMAMDEAVDLLAQLPRKTKDSLMARLPKEKAARAEILALSALRHGTQILLCCVVGDGRRSAERGHCPLATGHRTGQPRQILPTVKNTAHRR